MTNLPDMYSIAVISCEGKLIMVSVPGSKKLSCPAVPVKEGYLPGAAVFGLFEKAGITRKSLEGRIATGMVFQKGRPRSYMHTFYVDLTGAELVKLGEHFSRLGLKTMLVQNNESGYEHIHEDDLEYIFPFIVTEPKTMGGN